MLDALNSPAARVAEQQLIKKGFEGSLFIPASTHWSMIVLCYMRLIEVYFTLYNADTPNIISCEDFESLISLLEYITLFCAFERLIRAGPMSGIYIYLKRLLNKLNVLKYCCNFLIISVFNILGENLQQRSSLSIYQCSGKTF